MPARRWEGIHTQPADECADGGQLTQAVRADSFASGGRGARKVEQEIGAIAFEATGRP
ncbi:hypothetical protein HEK616_42840 [Streptomyces nigrescens]|uniref:Uncharacterized protein n=1 Tax=Streptomyces nigrescens TaxID=1920 RepID=A0ABM7ZWS2_STRNI|nr:hypothetical protein HEK616_42840 [Streptomyces nigrescens]